MKAITPQQWATLEFDSAVVINSQYQLDQLASLVKEDISDWGRHYGFPFVLYREVNPKNVRIRYSSVDYYTNCALIDYPSLQSVKIIFKLLKTKEYSNGKN